MSPEAIDINILFSVTHPEEYREFVNQLDQFRQRQAPISAPSVASSAAETSSKCCLFFNIFLFSIRRDIC